MKENSKKGQQRKTETQKPVVTSVPSERKEIRGSFGNTGQTKKGDASDSTGSTGPRKTDA